MSGSSEEAAVVSNFQPIDVAIPSNLIFLKIFCQLTLGHVILLILAHVSLVRAG